MNSPYLSFKSNCIFKGKMRDIKDTITYLLYIDYIDGQLFTRKFCEMTCSASGGKKLINFVHFKCF